MKPEKNAKKKLDVNHIEVAKTLHAVQEDFTRSILSKSKVCTLTMDIQKVFSLSKLTHFVMCYAR